MKNKMFFIAMYMLLAVAYDVVAMEFEQPNNQQIVRSGSSPVVSKKSKLRSLSESSKESPREVIELENVVNSDIVSSDIPDDVSGSRGRSTTSKASSSASGSSKHSREVTPMPSPRNFQPNSPRIDALVNELNNLENPNSAEISKVINNVQNVEENEELKRELQEQSSIQQNIKENNEKTPTELGERKSEDPNAKIEQTFGETGEYSEEQAAVMRNTIKLVLDAKIAEHNAKIAEHNVKIAKAARTAIGVGALAVVIMLLYKYDKLPHVMINCINKLLPNGYSI